MACGSHGCAPSPAAAEAGNHFLSTAELGGPELRTAAQLVTPTAAAAPIAAPPPTLRYGVRRGVAPLKPELGRPFVLPRLSLNLGPFLGALGSPKP